MKKRQPSTFLNFVVGGSVIPGQGGFSTAGNIGTYSPDGMCNPGIAPGQAGGPGGLVIFENTGT